MAPSFRFARSGLGFSLIAVSACAPRPIRLVVVTSSVAQTISLLGDTLYGLPLDPAGGPARVRRIQAARGAVARDSSDISAWLRLGRSTVEMGRLRDAVGVYSTLAEVHFEDPRVWRHRGEVLLRLRYLDRAIADLRKAGLLALNKPRLLESLPGTGDSVSGRSAWADLTTLQYQVPFLLGFALYCKGDYSAASTVLAEATRAALTADELSHAMLWLFFAVRRIGDGSGAAEVLSLVRPEWAEGARLPDITLLLGYKGQFSSDTIRARAMTLRSEAGALYSYGIAYYLMLKPETREDGELWLERARSGQNWAALPYLAAEADLARLRNAGRAIVR
jgi:tetratricopeptide (TPR) repeat protein